MEGSDLNILIVDDDAIIGPVLKDYLEDKGFNVTLVSDSLSAIQTVKNNNFNICLLDVKMPGKTGFELGTEISEIYPNLPFIFLTGETGKSDKIAGLKIGAEDYITKPFNLEELYLRILVVTRRSNRKALDTTAPEQYSIGKYIFKPDTRKLSYKDKTTTLSSIETQLLSLFCQSESGILDREFALKKVWKDEYMLKGRSLNVYVSKLREYLNQDTDIEILNIHGQGYQLIVK